MSGLAPPGANAFDFRNIDIPGSVDGSVLVKTGGIWLALPPGTPGDFLGISGGGVPAYTTIAGGGDMLAVTYDPSGVAASAFNLANFSIAAEAQGDVYFRGAAGWERLAAPVATGFVLTTNGSNPFWAAPSGDMAASLYDPTGVAASAFDLANFAIVAEAPGDLYTRGPGLWGRLAAGTVRQVLTVDVTSGLPAWADNQLPTAYVNGCGISAVIDAGLTIGTGSVRDSTDVIDIVVTAPVVLVMPTDLDTGAEAADTWYDVYVTRTSGGTIGGIFVVQGAGPTVAGGTTFRRVGTVRNDSGSDFIPYLQSGSGRERSYLYTSLRTTRLVLLGGTATTPTITAVDCSAFVPPTTQVGLLGFANNSTTRLMSLFQDVAGPAIALLDEEDTAASLFPTNASQQIAYTNTAGGGTANSDIAVGGYNESI